MSEDQEFRYIYPEDLPEEPSFPVDKRGYSQELVGEWVDKTLALIKDWGNRYNEAVAALLEARDVRNTLTAQNASLGSQVETLTEQVKTLTEQVETLTVENEQLKYEVSQTEAQAPEPAEKATGRHAGGAATTAPRTASELLKAASDEASELVRRTSERTAQIEAEAEHKATELINKATTQYNALIAEATVKSDHIIAEAKVHASELGKRAIQEASDTLYKSKVARAELHEAVERLKQFHSTGLQLVLQTETENEEAEKNYLALTGFDYSDEPLPVSPKLEEATEPEYVNQTELETSEAEDTTGTYSTPAKTVTEETVDPSVDVNFDFIDDDNNE